MNTSRKSTQNYISFGTASPGAAGIRLGVARKRFCNSNAGSGQFYWISPSVPGFVLTRRGRTGLNRLMRSVQYEVFYSVSPFQAACVTAVYWTWHTRDTCVSGTTVLRFFPSSWPVGGLILNPENAEFCLGSEPALNWLRFDQIIIWLVAAVLQSDCLSDWVPVHIWRLV